MAEKASILAAIFTSRYHDIGSKPREPKRAKTTPKRSVKNKHKLGHCSALIMFTSFSYFLRYELIALAMPIHVS
jgi:hypothetical protein